MSLPKNFTETNVVNRKKALNNLKWFIFHYDYELTEEFYHYLNEGYEKWGIVADDLGSHRVFASTENSAIEMFKMYMDTIYINTNKIKSYKIIFKTCEDGRFGNTTILS